MAEIDLDAIRVKAEAVGALLAARAAGDQPAIEAARERLEDLVDAEPAP